MTRGWRRRFEDPIPLPRGRQLVTLMDAADYITRFPKAEQEAAPWKLAAELLMLVGEHGGDPTFLVLSHERNPMFFPTLTERLCPLADFSVWIHDEERSAGISIRPNRN